MINLFNNVFVDYDFCFGTDTGKNILAASFVGFGHHDHYHANVLFAENSYDGLLQKIFSVSNDFDLNNGPLLYAEHSSEEDQPLKELSDAEKIIAEKRLWNLLIKYPKNEKLILYFEEDVYNRFCIKWLRALFEEHDDQFEYHLYKLYFYRDKLLFARSGRDRAYLFERLNNLEELSFEQFKKILNKKDGMRPLDRPNEYKNFPVEILLAHYLATQDKEVEQDINKLVRDVCFQFALGEVAGFRRDLLRSFMQLPVIFKALEGMATTFDLNEVVKREPRLEFLLDENFDKNNTDLLRKYGKSIGECYELYLDFMREKAEIGNSILMYILTQANENFNAAWVLERDIASEASSIIFGTGPTERKINPYFISYLYQLYRQKSANLKLFRLKTTEDE